MGGNFTFAHVGSCIFSQWRYAFKRHSSSHSGSPFLAEIRRITSSFKPGGTVSCSMSVTKPYLYSCVARNSTSVCGVAITPPKDQDQDHHQGTKTQRRPTNKEFHSSD